MQPSDSNARHRRRSRRQRQNLDPATRDEYSLAIAEWIAKTPQYRRAKNLGCYLAMPEEVDTWALIERAWRAQKRVFVPRIEKSGAMSFLNLQPRSAMRRNRFGLLEPQSSTPIPAQRLDLVLAPLVAFDDSGNRIGMGGGYYDRAFSFNRHRKCYAKPKLFGLAFACQKVDTIDASHWDVPVFQVFTENGPACDGGDSRHRVTGLRC